MAYTRIKVASTRAQRSKNGQTCMATNAGWLIHHGTRAKLQRKQTKVWVGIGGWKCVHQHLPRIGEWQKWQEWQKKGHINALY